MLENKDRRGKHRKKIHLTSDHAVGEQTKFK